jgi:hypothetical protein
MSAISRPYGALGRERFGMEWFKRMPIAAVAVVLGTISVLGWIVLDGTPALVISIIAGGLIALRATLGN